MSLDLPLIWAAIVALSVLMYVLLDGFDLGVGILFPFAASPQERDVMMDTVAPIWDGNETWLVLGGGAVFAAFPFAFSVLMPALYVPVIIMLLGLILRGVAFEFRIRGRVRGKRFWTVMFCAGSIIATLAQGFVLGGFIQGVTLDGQAFGGGAFDWLTPYTVLVSFGLVAGYALLGAAWVIWRTEDELHGRARRWAWISGAATAALLAAVSLATLLIHPRIAARWGFEGGAFDVARLAPLLPIPLLGSAGLAIAALGLRRHAHFTPFLGAFLVFLSGYLGLAVGFFPNIVPYDMTFRQAANAENALSLLLWGAALIVPMILGYTFWVYWVFRGKVSGDAGYH